MPDNAYTGAVEVDLCGVRHTLRYDWAALGRLRTEFGKDYEKVVDEAVIQADVDALSKALACGLTPQVTAEEISKASPPLVVVTTAIKRALWFAYFGVEGVPAEAQAKAADPLQRPKVTVWKRFSGLLFGRGSSRASSGA